MPGNRRPWKRDDSFLFRDEAGHEIHQIFDADDYLVCRVEVSANGTDDVSSRALELENVALIEAAPDLFAYLAEAIKVAEYLCIDERDDWYVNAKAVIARVTGKGE